ncbi:MAG: hypothetical protein HY582_03425, partial [Candidatus Omnitrophica bacterium]|nr:hypothetical protein [Candidatus Omnitrophota bacterium]
MKLKFPQRLIAATVLFTFSFTNTIAYSDVQFLSSFWKKEVDTIPASKSVNSPSYERALFELRDRLLKDPTGISKSDVSTLFQRRKTPSRLSRLFAQSSGVDDPTLLEDVQPVYDRAVINRKPLITRSLTQSVLRAELRLPQIHPLNDGDYKRLIKPLLAELDAIISSQNTVDAEQIYDLMNTAVSKFAKTDQTTFNRVLIILTRLLPPDRTFPQLDRTEWLELLPKAKTALEQLNPARSELRLTVGEREI